jgi:hypothetical protein
MRLIITKAKLLVLFFYAHTAMAQSSLKDELVNYYHSFQTESQPIYNGLEYSRIPFYVNSGIPYFISDTVTTGSVVYDGVLYKNLPLMYDMMLDELITKDFSGKNMIKMVKQRVDSFYLYGATFVCIKEGDKTISEGYYQVMQQEGKELFKKEIRYIKDKVKLGEEPEKNIVGKTTYYIKRDGKYFISNTPDNKK